MLQLRDAKKQMQVLLERIGHRPVFILNEAPLTRGVLLTAQTRSRYYGK